MSNENSYSKAVNEVLKRYDSLKLTRNDGDFSADSLREEVESRLFNLITILAKDHYFNRKKPDKTEAEKILNLLDLIRKKHYDYFSDLVLWNIGFDQNGVNSFFETLGVFEENLLSITNFKGRAGQKPINSKCSYILYSYLHRFSGNRKAIDCIGKLISYKGPLNKKYDDYRQNIKAQYGVDLFEYDYLKLPTVADTKQGAWERGVKDTMKNQALNEYRRHPFLLLKSDVIPDNIIKQAFNVAMENGGFFSFEIEDSSFKKESQLSGRSLMVDYLKSIKS